MEGFDTKSFNDLMKEYSMKKVRGSDYSEEKAAEQERRLQSLNDRTVIGGYDAMNPLSFYYISLEANSEVDRALFESLIEKLRKHYLVREANVVNQLGGTSG